MDLGVLRRQESLPDGIYSKQYCREEPKRSEAVLPIICVVGSPYPTMNCPDKQ